MQRKVKSIKTRKSVAKRFKITASGKIVRNRPGKRHLLASKNAKRRRKLGTPAIVDQTDYARVMENMPFSHSAVCPSTKHRHESHQRTRLP